MYIFQGYFCWYFTVYSYFSLHLRHNYYVFSLFPSLAGEVVQQSRQLLGNTDFEIDMFESVEQKVAYVTPQLHDFFDPFLNPDVHKWIPKPQILLFGGVLPRQQKGQEMGQLTICRYVI